MTRSISSLCFGAATALVILACALPAVAQRRDIAGGARPITAPNGVSSQHWVQTWTSPIVSLTNDNLAALNQPPAQFTNQTIRMITHLTVGGSSFRVRFSNFFGAQALNVGAAHVALRASGANTVPGTDQQLTFSGQNTVAIPPGAEIVSDPVAITVANAGDLAVSLFLPDTGVPDVTLQPFSHQTSYISMAASGDQTATTTFPTGATASTPSGWFFLIGVETLAPAATSAIIAFGDSITEGLQSTTDANHRWPDRLAERLLARNSNFAITDVGISGNKVLTDNPGPSALSRIDREALAYSGVKHMVVLLGINDINGGSTAADLIAGHRQFIARAHDRGVKILGATLTPVKGESGYSATVEAARSGLNNFIRNAAEYDGVIDFDAATRNPSDPLSYNPAYNSGDSLHPNDAGYQAMANAIDLTLFDGSMTLSSVVSRKTHGASGVFDLPLAAGVAVTPTIESRGGGANNAYTLVFTFTTPVTSMLGAAVAEGVGTVDSVVVNSGDPRIVTANLIGVTSGQYVTVGLTNVSDGVNTSSVRATMGILIGDVGGNGAVNAADVAQIKSLSGQTVTGSNFLADLNEDGVINAADVAFAKSKSGSSLPASPPTAPATNVTP